MIIMVLIKVLLIFAFAVAFSVPKTRTDKEIFQFYEGIEGFDVKIQRYDELGFGVQALRGFKKGDSIFCMGLNVSLYPSTEFTLSEYIKESNPIDRLVARVLYEKFINKNHDFYNNYINTFPTEFESPALWTQKERELFNKFNFVKDFEKVFDRTKEHALLIKNFNSLMGMKSEMLSYENYLWAYEKVVTQSKIMINSQGKEVYVLSPFLDMVNHWPNPWNYTELSFRTTETEHCLISGWNYRPGDQIFVDYGRYESVYYFYKYKFNIDNPHDFIEISPHDSIEISGYLHSNVIHFDLLQKILDKNNASTGKIYNIEKYLLDMSDKYKTTNLLNALFKYKSFITNHPDLKEKPGIRESRRIAFKSKAEKTIKSFAIAQRKTIYNHLRILDRKIMHSLHKLIF